MIPSWSTKLGLLLCMYLRTYTVVYLILVVHFNSWSGCRSLSILGSYIDFAGADQKDAHFNFTLLSWHITTDEAAGIVKELKLNQGFIISQLQHQHQGVICVVYNEQAVHVLFCETHIAYYVAGLNAFLLLLSFSIVDLTQPLSLSGQKLY